MRPDTTRRLAGPERLENRTTMDATGFIDIPTVRFIAEHARLQLHAELDAEVWTSWERYGTSGTDGILRSVGTNAGTAGNPDNPSGQDALVLRFNTPIIKPTTVHLWTEGIPPTNVYAWVNSAQRRVDGAADGTIRINASPEQPISTLSILASGGGRYGIDALDIEADPPPKATTVIDIPALRTISHDATVVLTPELSMRVRTGSEVNGSTGTEGILRSIGNSGGRAGTPENPLATDHLIMQFTSPIVRPTTVKLWTEGVSPTEVFAWVNAETDRVYATAEGMIHIDASAEHPIEKISIINYTDKRVGVDAIEIEKDAVVEPVPEEDDDDEHPITDPSPEFSLPTEFNDLLTEAVHLSLNDPEWRTPETTEITEKPLKKGLHVNLRSAEFPIIGYRSTVTGSTPITAHVYRGTTLRASIPVPTDGTFTYDDAGGFTDVLFTTTSITSITVNNTTILVDEDQVPEHADPIGIFTSKHYGIANAPVVPIPNSVSYVAGRLKFYDSPTIWGESRRYIMRDPQQFTMIRSMVTAGSGRISMIGTIKKDGVDYMGREYGSTSGFPEGYAQWVGENIAIVAPGAPAPISFIVGTYGSRGSIVVTHGASMEELLPPSTMSQQTIDVNLIDMNEQHQTTGIFPPLTEVQEGSSPVFASPGHIANLQYHIRNDALNGGLVTARVYVGWHSGEPARGTLQETFTLSMGGGNTQRISTNVTAPSKPSDATSERPIISVVLALPNGETVENAKLGKEPKSSEKRVFTQKKDGNTTMHIESGGYTQREQARIHALTDRALNALLTSSHKSLVAVRDTLGVDHVIDLIARNTAAAFAAAEGKTDAQEATDIAMAELGESVEEDVENLLHDREGVGGSDDVPPNTEKLLTRGIQDGEYSSAALEAAGIVGMRTPSSIFNEVLSWTVPSDHALSDNFSGINTSTMAGRILTSGIMQMHSSAGSPASQWKTAFMIQAVTDIPANMLMDVANAGIDIAVTRKFEALLGTAQYTHLTSPNTAPTTPAIVMAAVNKPRYQAGDQQIRIRFDIAGTASGVKSVQVLEGGIVLNGARSIGFITVPIMNMPSRVPPTTGPLPEFVECNFVIKVVLEDGTVIERSVNNFEIDIHLPDVLRDPPTGNEGEDENIDDVTSLIRDHFPLGNAANYYMYLGSSYHDGNEFYAADLNSLGGTDTDRGHVMKAIASGTIRFGNSGSYTGNEAGDLRLGVIVIDHGEGLQSGYMHMPIFKGAMKPHPTTGAVVQHYEVRQQEPIYTMLNGAQRITGMRFTGDIIEFYDGMPIGQDSPTGYVGGRNGGSEDAGYYEGLNNAHSHFFVKKNGASVNLWPGLSAAGMTVMKAYDTGPDGVPDQGNDSQTITVRFDQTLQSWVNDELKLVVNRSNQEPLSPGVQTGQYFMAWEETDLTQMKKIIYKKVGEVTDATGKTTSIFRWVKHDAVDNTNSIWDPLSQSWTSFAQ